VASTPFADLLELSVAVETAPDDSLLGVLRDARLVVEQRCRAETGRQDYPFYCELRERLQLHMRRLAREARG
jgi:hypothetical protein